MAFVGAFHGKRVALFAFAQRALAALDATQLVNQSGDGQPDDGADNQILNCDTQRLPAPSIEHSTFFAPDRNDQRKPVDVRAGNETPNAVDRRRQPHCRFVRKLSDQSAIDFADTVQHRRLAHDERAVVVQQEDRAARAEIDLVIELLELVEIDRATDDTREPP